MKTYVITGASGFLGNAVLQSLIDSARVITVRYRNSHQFLTECSQVIRETKPYALLNLGAAQMSGDDDVSTASLLDSNVIFPSQILSTIKEHSLRTKFITIGTGWENDDHGCENPFNLYAATKIAIRPIVQHYLNEGLNCARLRLYDTYGPQDKRPKLINQIIDAYINQKILNMSAGEQKIDLVFIQDAVSAIIAAANQEHRVDKFEYEISTKKAIKIKDILSIVDNFSETRPEEINLGYYNYRKNERFELTNTLPWVPGWMPDTSLLKGLEITYMDRRNEKT